VQETIEAIIAFVRDHEPWISPIVFLIGMAESIPVLSLFVPSTALFVGVGAVHGAAGGSFVTLWSSGAAGACVGDIISYTIGRLFEARLLTMWPLSKNPHWWHRGHDFFERWGFLGVIGGKFVGPLRAFVPVVAGAVEMPFLWFLTASAISSLMWAGVFLAPGSLGLSWLQG